MRTGVPTASRDGAWFGSARRTWPTCNRLGYRAATRAVTDSVTWAKALGQPSAVCCPYPLGLLRGGALYVGERLNRVRGRRGSSGAGEREPRVSSMRAEPHARVTLGSRLLNGCLRIDIDPLSEDLHCPLTRVY